jgi:dipeptidyl aminopeptidase/acylaminoacyl peptidase
MFYCHGGPHASSEENIELLQNLSYEFKINIVSFDFRGSKIKGYKNVAQIYNDQQNFSAYLNSGDTDYGGIHLDDLQRIMDGTLKLYPTLIDDQKLVIAGHSFGGYLTAVAITDPNLSRKFKLAIIISGFFDLGKYAWSNAFSFNDDVNVQQRRSPTNFVQNISQPVLVIQGDAVADKTTLVSREDTEAFIRAAKAKGKDIHSLFLNGLSHNETEESREAWTFVKPWIERLAHLKEEGVPP